MLLFLRGNRIIDLPAAEPKLMMFMCTFLSTKIVKPIKKSIYLELIQVLKDRIAVFIIYLCNFIIYKLIIRKYLSVQLSIPFMFVNIFVLVNVYVVLYDVNKAKTHSVPRYRQTSPKPILQVHCCNSVIHNTLF